MHTHWFGMVRKAVAEHHESTTDLFSTLLKEADGRARQLEIDEERHRASLSWETWFDVTTFLAMVGAKVDVIQTGHLWHAFSIDGTVYCDPTFLYETADALALTKNVLDISLLRDTDKDRALGEDREKPEKSERRHRCTGRRLYHPPLYGRDRAGTTDKDVPPAS